MLYAYQHIFYHSWYIFLDFFQYFSFFQIVANLEKKNLPIYLLKRNTIQVGPQYKWATIQVDLQYNTSRSWNTSGQYKWTIQVDHNKVDLKYNTSRSTIQVDLHSSNLFVQGIAKRKFICSTHSEAKLKHSSLEQRKVYCKDQGRRMGGYTQKMWTLWFSGKFL